MRSRISVGNRIAWSALSAATRAAEALRHAWPVALLCLAMLSAGAVWLAAAGSTGTWSWKSWERLFGSPAPSHEGAAVRALQARPDALGSSSLQITPFDVPGAGTGTLEGTLGIVINASGEVAGMYSNSSRVLRGFVRDASGNFTTFDPTGAGTTPPLGSVQGTIPTAIDTAGNVAGAFIDSTNAYHSFLRTTDGTITEFDAPGASTAVSRGTSALGMNDAGQIVGFYTTGSPGDNSSTYHGFLRAADGTFTPIDAPGAGSGVSPIGRKQGTTAGVINASGEIAGTYVDSNNTRHGFVRSTDGTITSFDPTGSTTSANQGGFGGTEVIGIDTAGDVVGAYTDASLVRHGYVRAANGTITSFDVPGATTVTTSGSISGTFPIGIDPGGNYVVGTYSDSSKVNHGFVYTQPLSGNGTITPFDAPNAGTAVTVAITGTAAAAVNASGEVVGGYIDTNNVAHGFLLNIPAQAVAATPTFSPPAGTYASPQSVTISDTTSGATIYYTTDNSTPTTNSTVYSGPIPVNSSETIKAIATASGFSQSAVATATYIIGTPPVAATPTFNPPGGTYATAQSVTISDTTPGATIYYTTNGATPNTGSTAYRGAFIVASTETLKAIAVASGFSPSTVASVTYVITAQPGQNTTIYTYQGHDYGTVSGVTCGGNYCTGGPYALAVTFTTTLTGSALDNLPLTNITSTVASFKFTDGSSLVEDNSTGKFPGFQIATDASGNIVSWLVGTCGSSCNIQMQTNWHTVFSFQPGADFSETTASFAGSFGFVSNNPGTWTQTVGPPIQPPSAPTFSPAPGLYASAQTVTISDATSGTTIYYTTDGSTPTTMSTVYGGPITVGGTETLEAIAVIPGVTASTVATAQYAIGSPFTIQLASGSSSSATVSPGGTANYSWMIAPSVASGLPADVNFTATGLPSGATATFTPNPLPAGSGPTPVMLAIQTSSASALLNSGGAFWPVAFSSLMVPLAGVRRRRNIRRPGYLLRVFVLCALTTAMVACGGGSSGGGGGGGPSPHTYTITITAASGPTQQTTTVSLTVQ